MKYKIFYYNLAKHICTGKLLKQATSFWAMKACYEYLLT